MTKNHSISWWKNKAKYVFQKFIRLRDADSSGICTCVTCGKKYHWKDINAGHFIPAEWIATCFMEINCHAQCVHCNLGLQGNTDSYFLFMEKKYSRGSIDSLIEKKHLKVKHSIDDYKDIIDMYTDKVNELCKQKFLF